MHERGALLIEAVVAAPDVVATVAATMRAALEQQGVSRIPIEVRPVDAIARHATSGKLKLIESR